MPFLPIKEVNSKNGALCPYVIAMSRRVNFLCTESTDMTGNSIHVTDREILLKILSFITAYIAKLLFLIRSISLRQIMFKMQQ